MAATTTAGAATRVAAIARRDLSIQLSYPLAMITRYSQALFLALILHFIARLIRNPPALARYGGEYVPFAATGLVVTAFVTVGLNAIATAISTEQANGSLEALLATPTRLGTLLTGSCIVPLLLTLGDAAVYFTVAYALDGFSVSAANMLICVLPVAALTVTFAALGLVSASFIILTKRPDPFTLVLAQSTALLAGAVFPVAVLPGPLQVLVRAFPAYWGLEGVRAVLLRGEGLSGVLGPLAVLACFSAVLIPVGFACFRRALKVARVTGTLGNY